MYSNILIPTDGSELSARAIADGVALAAAIGARVTAWCGAEVYSMSYVEGVFVDLEQFRSRALGHARKHVDAVAAAATAVGVACETHTEECETVWGGILKAARDHACDLIVMASHERRGLSAVLLGSETQKVLTHGTLPVLVCR